jgi:spermidine synthase
MLPRERSQSRHSPLAERYFTYLRDSKAKVEVLLGDARLVLERQLNEGDAQGFDILVLDAFRGASPPLHLMTAEAFNIYFSHLAADGILGINIEIDTFEVAPLHRGMARKFGVDVGWFQTEEGPDCLRPVSWALYLG